MTSVLKAPISSRPVINNNIHTTKILLKYYTEMLQNAINAYIICGEFFKETEFAAVSDN